MDKLKSLMIFIRSAQSGSFSEAARHLGMAPSAVSRAVLRLEDDLGVRLLQRTTRSLTLTEDGNRFYQRSEQILNDLEEAELEVKQSQSMPLGTLRLDLSFVFGKIHIAPALLQFVTQYPKLNLNVSFNDRVIDLIEEGIDATVRIGMSSDSRLIMHHLATARYITCASPQYLAQYGTPTIPTELLQHRCVNFIYPQTGREPKWKFEQDGKAIDLCVESYLRFDNSEVILEAVIQGAGVVQFPKFIAAKAIARGDLQPILQSYTTQVGLPISVLYPQKRYLCAKVRVFVEFMTELMAALKRVDIVD
ncbi:MAG: LysR family transcriptional regulator [Nostoc sp. NMS1]|jgi:LysR family transcriptional regulator for bpeEF and oprC|uniref:LysR family transcriptional regulator n=1 Tax=unclassified Nostoc TaxID=2593658 RepID=UPI0025E3F29E|nr:MULTISPECIES: LysR family transcriptional regulator [unclassified Nostoc]MBN3907564.1 LysR family transcriptional regulator [Nostoc sp. NMS1]MBN3994587.1 LysR family transcriptional regulator [Nostoc sp. NMS2]